MEGSTGGVGDDLSQWVHMQSISAASPSVYSATSPSRNSAGSGTGQAKLSLTTQLADNLDNSSMLMTPQAYMPSTRHGLDFTAIPQPIPPPSAGTAFDLNGRHDTNEYDDSFALDNYSYGTPSYAGSWDSSSASQHLVSGGETSRSASHFEYLYNKAQLEQQQHSQNHRNLGNSYDAFLSYREPHSLLGGGLGGLEDDAGSAYGGSHFGSSMSGAASSAAGGSVAGSVIGAEDALSMADLDFDPVTITDGSRSASPIAGVEQIGINGQLYDAGKTLDVASGSPSPASPGFSFSSPYADSPGSGPLEVPRRSSSAFNRTTSPPLLAPLAIPSDGPSFNLIQPTPHTARPRDHQKGQGTLELERLLGMNNWNAETQTQSFSNLVGTGSSVPDPASHPLTSSSSASQASAIFPGSLTDPPEPFETGDASATVSRITSTTPAHLESLLRSTQPQRERQRSRSEADLRDSLPPQPQLPPASSQAAYALAAAYATGTFPSHLSAQNQTSSQSMPHPEMYPQGYPNSASGAPFHLDPVIAWQLIQASQQQQQQQQQYQMMMDSMNGHVQPQGDQPTPQDLAAYAYQQQQRWLATHQSNQHELALRSHTSMGIHSHAAPAGTGGPGYQEAAMLRADHSYDPHVGVSHRRSISHGGHPRSSRNDTGSSRQNSGDWHASTSYLEPPPRRKSRASHEKSRSAYTSPHNSRPASPAPAGESAFDPPPPAHPASMMHQSPVSTPAQISEVPSFPAFVSIDEDDDVPSRAVPPRTASGSAFPAGVGPTSYQAAHLAAGPPPHHAFVYHSPSPSVGSQAAPPSEPETPPLRGPTASTSSVKAGKRAAVTRESKTTQATIDAAMRRRNPGTQAKFACDLCGETFTRRYNLRGHQRAHRNEKPFLCAYEGCGKAFARAHDCKRHELLHLNVRRYQCEPCQRDFVRLDALQRHHRSEIGQECVNQLREQGYTIPYDTGSGVNL